MAKQRSNTPPRGRGGRFVSSGRPASTQLVVRDQVSITQAQPRSRSIVRRVAAPIYTAVARYRGRGGGGASSSTAGSKVRKGVALAGAVIGYTDRPGSPAEATLQKIPALGGSRKITMAILLHLWAKKRPGGYIDHTATAMTAIAAYDVGRNGIGNLGLQGPGTVARF